MLLLHLHYHHLNLKICSLLLLLCYVSVDHTTCDLVSDTLSSSLTTAVFLSEIFETKFAPADISTLCLNSRVLLKLTTYPINQQKSSFRLTGTNI
jgi:hypothetical protein